ncbi:MAG: ketol-acid reductoisomerase [Candidatus Zixiibacteriota bacterium]
MLGKCGQFIYIFSVKSGLKKTRIALLGYGSQGRAWALDLRDSGHNIIIGLPRRSKSIRIARRDGFKEIAEVSKAVALSQIVIFAFPDHLHGKVYKKDIKPYLKPKTALVFLHGFSLHFRTVIPPNNCDIILLAPLAPGRAVRENYLKKKPVAYFYSIHRDATGMAKATLTSLVHGLRIARRNLIETTVADEAIGDIFGEQAVLCGGLSQLIKAGYDTLVAAGLSSDKAYLEVAYQIDLIVEMIKKFGIEGMLSRISLTARIGSILSGRRIIDSSVKSRMKKVLAEIKSGKFARRLTALDPKSLKRLDAAVRKMSSAAFEKSARKFAP